MTESDGECARRRDPLSYARVLLPSDISFSDGTKTDSDSVRCAVQSSKVRAESRNARTRPSMCKATAVDVGVGARNR